MPQQIDRIIQIDIYKNGVLNSGSYTDQAKDFIQQIIQLGDKLHNHLHKTMPSDGYW